MLSAHNNRRKEAEAEKIYRRFPSKSVVREKDKEKRGDKGGEEATAAVTNENMEGAVKEGWVLVVVFQSLSPHKYKL